MLEDVQLNGIGYYSIWLIVYEPPQNNGKIKEILEKFEISKKIINQQDRYDLESVKTMVWGLNYEKVIIDNPILYVHPRANWLRKF